MKFNGQLAVGNHAQVVEVELQREYEGKLAHPDYVIEGIINGFDDLGPSQKKGLRDIIHAPQLRGVWTWRYELVCCVGCEMSLAHPAACCMLCHWCVLCSRGGGWWGPYIHGHGTYAASQAA